MSFEDFLLNVKLVMTTNLKNPAVPLIDDMIAYAFSKSGKNIRSRLIYVMGQPLLSKNLSLIAALVELVHAGTLIHDDVIDSTMTRRGIASLHLMYGNTRSILFGDYIFTKVFKMATEIPDSLQLLKELSQCTHNLTEGELLQLDRCHTKSTSFNDYLRIIQLKTGSLFSFALWAVAHTHYDLGIRSQAHLYAEFGLNFGVYFQIVDDVLDYLGAEIILGKKPGNDFEERKITFPLFIAANSYPELIENMQNNQMSFSDAKEVIMLQRSCIFDATHQYYKNCLDSLAAITSSNSAALSILSHRQQILADICLKTVTSNEI